MNALALSTNEYASLEVHASGIGDRLKQIVDVVRFLKNLDTGKIQVAFDLLRVIGSSESLNEKIEAAVKLFDLVAQATTTEVDNKIADLLNKLVSSGALAVIVPLVEQLLKAHTQAVACDYETLTSIAQTHNYQATGFDLATLVAVAKLIAELVSLLRQ